MTDKIKINIILIFLILSFFLGITGIILKKETAKSESLGIKKIAFSLKKSNDPGIGYLYISGPIYMGPSVSPMFQDSNSSEAIVKSIYHVLDKSNIKALLIKINSPGGTVAATQEIYNAVQHIRSQGIYTVASIGDMAASGGYYVASACDAIFANPGSITGSIGVIISSPNLKRFFDKFGISFNTIKGGKFKDILSSSRDMSPEELKMMQETIDSTYEQFLKDVARGRKMDLTKVRKLAEGKIYNGEQALKLGLVSQLGDFRQALYYAHQMAKLPGTVPNLIPLVDNPWDDFINQFPKIETHTLPNLISAMARIIISGDYNSAKPMTQSPERKFMDNRNQSDAIIQYRYLP